MFTSPDPRERSTQAPPTCAICAGVVDGAEPWVEDAGAYAHSECLAEPPEDEEDEPIEE